MKLSIEISHTKKNRKDNYIKLVQVKRLLIIPLIFSEVKMNMNDL